VSHCTTNIEYLRKKCSITKQKIKLDRPAPNDMEDAELIDENKK